MMLALIAIGIYCAIGAVVGGLWYRFTDDDVQELCLVAGAMWPLVPFFGLFRLVAGPL